MALSALDDRSAEPTDAEVAGVLGDSFSLWTSLRDWLVEAGVDGHQWGFSGAKYGWGLRAKHGKRVIAYLIPQRDGFLVGLVFGDRAVAAVESSPIPDPVREIIATARRYAEGTGFRVPVTSAAELDNVKTLVEIKMRC